MQERDKMIRASLRLCAVGALPMLLCLPLFGCGSGNGQHLVKHDASAPEAQPEEAIGPEAGPETSGLPTTPQACAAATSVGPCLSGIPIATIKRASGGPLLAAVTVTRGTCRADTCVAGCESIGVYNESVTIGATCDLRLTAIDGRTQSVQLTVVANPSPMYACCGFSQAPSPGQWVALNPGMFSPSSVVVDFAAFTLDGGTALIDSGIDGGGLRDTAGLDSGSLDLTVDTPPAADGKSDAYRTPTDEQSCLAATGVLICDLGVPIATVRSAADGTMLTKVAVTSGACSGATCSACNSLTVYGSTSQYAGATCDLLITTSDGSKQAARIAVIANPSPVYMCCGYPLPPNPGRWTALQPLAFSPATVLVTAAIDGGIPSIIDGGAPPDVPFSE
jgi:hypothetical protein